MGALGVALAHRVFVVVQDDGHVLDGWHPSDEDALAFIEDEAIEENCGPVSVVELVVRR